MNSIYTQSVCIRLICCPFCAKENCLPLFNFRKIALFHNYWAKQTHTACYARSEVVISHMLHMCAFRISAAHVLSFCKWLEITRNTKKGNIKINVNITRAVLVIFLTYLYRYFCGLITHAFTQQNGNIFIDTICFFITHKILIIYLFIFITFPTTLEKYECFSM